MRLMNRLVSIIVPVYNMQDYLVETMDSLTACTYSPLEIVVYNDGSADRSLAILKEYAEKDSRIRLFSDGNSGVCATRNKAIREAKGDYILPFDADNILVQGYVEQAVDVLEKNPEIKVVGCRIEMFGDKSGMMPLRKYSKQLLARKNMIDNCSMFRRADWMKTRGYSETIQGWEDWDMWIEMLKTGGEYCQLPITGFKYRVRGGSRRLSTRNKKNTVIASINKDHAAFENKMLGGPLREKRTWSRFINFFSSILGKRSFEASDLYDAEEVFSMPEDFVSSGLTIYKGRNELKKFDGKGWVVKSFKAPNIFRAIIYGWLTKSKARRSFEYGSLLLEKGINNPKPIGYVENRAFGLLKDSYYISECSACGHTFWDLIKNKEFENREEILRAIGIFTAKMHEAGVIHKDYSAGNILFSSSKPYKIEVVDLNRLTFKKNVSSNEGIKNFERLNIDKAALEVMAEAYAEARGFDVAECKENIVKMRWYKHVKAGCTNL